LIRGVPFPDGIGIADIDEDGAMTGLRQLGLDPGSNLWTDPKWSPDGGQLVFVLMMDSALRVGIANADGSGFELVGKEVYENRAIDLTWAPDGRSLVIFDNPRDPDTPYAPGAKVWSVDVATGEQTEVQTPVWSVWSWQRLAP
jgi:Tol biopolymer transport system component